MTARHYMEWCEIGEAIIAALDEGAGQREVAKHLGKLQTWVNTIARWYLKEHGQSRWYLPSTCEQPRE